MQTLNDLVKIHGGETPVLHAVIGDDITAYLKIKGVVPEDFVGFKKLKIKEKAKLHFKVNAFRVLVEKGYDKADMDWTIFDCAYEEVFE